MTHVPHELAADFPEYADKISAMKQDNSHFAKLVDEYHVVNREVHRIEAGVETVADQYAEDVRKKRMRLKDEIYAMLTLD